MPKIHLYFKRFFDLSAFDREIEGSAELRIDRNTAVIIGYFTFVTYSAVSLFSNVADQFFSVVWVPPFLGSQENLLFIMSLGMILSIWGENYTRDKLSVILLTCLFIAGIAILFDSLLLLSESNITAILPTTTSVLLIVCPGRQLWKMFVQSRNVKEQGF